MIRYLLGLLSLMALVACDQPTAVVANNNSALSKPGTVLELHRSRSNAGGLIRISHRLPDKLAVGQQALIVLDFELDAYQALKIEIKPGTGFNLDTDSDVFLAGTETGQLTMVVKLTPRQAGKSYLKLLAVSMDESRLRSYAIALNIGDTDGHVPTPEHVVSKRINLPSTPHR